MFMMSAHVLIHAAPRQNMNWMLSASWVPCNTYASPPLYIYMHSFACDVRIYIDIHTHPFISAVLHVYELLYMPYWCPLKVSFQRTSAPPWNLLTTPRHHRPRPVDLAVRTPCGSWAAAGLARLLLSTPRVFWLGTIAHYPDKQLLHCCPQVVYVYAVARSMAS